MWLDHLTAVVTDAEAASGALCRLLGGEVVAETELAGMRIHTLRLGESELHLNAPVGPGPIDDFHRAHGPGLHHLALRVEDLACALGELAERGIVARGEPVEVALGIREVFLEPSSVGGLWIQLVERSAPRGKAVLDGRALARVARSGPARVEREEHLVDVGAVGRVRILETRPSSEAQRTLVFLPGPIATGGFFHIGVDGYDAGERLAREGCRTFSVDLPGSGGSFRPPDGRTLDFATVVETVSTALRQLARRCGVEAVDLVGESFGGAIASQIAADERFVRSCTLVSVLFRTPSAAAFQTFLHPGWRAMLEAAPQGYLEVGSELLGGILGRSPEAVQEWVLAHEAGRYAIGPMLSVFDLPYFDPSRARARGLVLHGEHEMAQSLDDARELAARYGTTGARWLEIEGAGHVPRIEHPEARERFWRAVLDFVLT